MRDTIDKHGVTKSPSGSWITKSRRVLILDSWFIDPEGSVDALKLHITEWLDDQTPGWSFQGYSLHGAMLTFATDAHALMFRMYWDDRVPK